MSATDPSLTTGNSMNTASELALVSARLMDELHYTGGARPVADEFGGRIFNDTYPLNTASRELQTIIEQAGFVFEDSSITAHMTRRTFMPDPERLLACAQTHDIPIKFVAEADPQSGRIPGTVFADVVRSGYHPVGVNNLALYSHDVSCRDHFLTVLVGGRPLIEWIVDKTPDHVNLARSYDQATDTITFGLRRLFATDAKSQTDFEGAIREVPRCLLNDQHMTGLTPEAKEALQYEVLSILYEGLERLNIRPPEMLTQLTLKKLGGWMMRATTRED